MNRRKKEIEIPLNDEVIPTAHIKDVIRLLQDTVDKHDYFGLILVDDLLSELFPQRSKPPVLLREARRRAKLTQHGLARKVGTSQPAIAAMEAGRRPVGKSMSRRLSKVLNVNYRLLL